MSGNASVRERVAQNDVTVMRSYLEVDVATWFSVNEIPYAYEQFTIPSVVGPQKDEWDDMVTAIKAVGGNNFDLFDQVTEGTRWEDMRPAELLSMWTEIYDKHELQNEQVFVEIQRSLTDFGKQLILPDFALYLDEDIGEGGRATVSNNFDWSSWDYLIEVSGLWGVGLPGEPTEQDWWTWYRVSAVAFKELVYKLLGLWDEVVWVLPNQTFIEGATDGIPQAIRRDENYVVMNTTSGNLELPKLADRLGITADPIPSGLSPFIGLIQYNRPLNRGQLGGFEVVEWTYDTVRMDAVNANPDVVAVDDDMIVFHGDMGELYISDNGVQVRDSEWRETNMILLREYALDSVQTLSEDGIIEGLEKA